MGAAVLSGQPLRLAVRCGKCGAAPAIRISTAMQRRFDGADPRELAGTYECHRRERDGRKCGELILLYADHFQRAS